jgi:hypothetical protein
MQKQADAALSRLIQQEVRAQMKRFAMAKSREDFINRLVEVLIPALRHHYRAALGVHNQRTDQVDKWRQEEDDFLDQFADRLQEVTKAKKLDRRKAVEHAIKELLEHDEARARFETVAFQKTYKLKTLTPVPPEAREEFLLRVREIVDAIFPA